MPHKDRGDPSRQYPVKSGARKSERDCAFQYRPTTLWTNQSGWELPHLELMARRCERPVDAR
jgi:hypothetical protein